MATALEWRENDNSIVIGGGDYFNGGPFSKDNKRDLRLQLHLDLGTEVSAVGQYEFKEGLDKALALFADTKHHIKWVCSNLHKRITRAKVLKEKYGYEMDDIMIHK